MSTKTKDLIGRVVGRWTVVSYVGKSYWLCRCECGTERHVFTGNLTARKSLSCGCFRDDRASACNRTHGLSKTVEYRVWAGIKRRCLNPNDQSYPDYGGRGITICQRWSESFESFLEDVGYRPSPKHEIDRYPDTNGNYEPGNVRWATRLQNARNKRSNRLITHGGVTKTLSQWADELGVGHETIAYRLRNGWSLERALTVPPVVGRNQHS